MGSSDDVRERLLSAAWGVIRGWNTGNLSNLPAASRALASGASPDDVARAMNAAAYEAVFALLHLLSAEHAEEGNYDAESGWMLVTATLDEGGEASPVDSTDLDYLHEDLLSADPTGSQGSDLFA